MVREVDAGVKSQSAAKQESSCSGCFERQISLEDKKNVQVLVRLLETFALPGLALEMEARAMTLATAICSNRAYSKATIGLMRLVLAYSTLAGSPPRIQADAAQTATLDHEGSLTRRRHLSLLTISASCGVVGGL